MRTRHLLIPLLFLAAAFAVADEPKKVDEPKKDEDPIVADLRKDKEAYVAAVGKAKEELLKAFDKRYESVKNNKTLKIETQLAQLEKIEAEKKAFDESGVPPTLIGMKVALSDYRTAVKKAEATCKAAFEKAAKAYRDKNDIKIAAATLDEMKEFLAAGGAAPAATTPVVLVSTHSGKVMGLARGSTDENTRIVTADYVKGDQTQLWKLVPAADGFVYVENVKAGLVIAVGGKGNGADIHISKKKDGDGSQLWKPVPVKNTKGAVIFASKNAPDRVMAITQGSKNAGVRIILWDDNTNGGPEHGYLPTPPK
jgi:hypothetical protein